MALRHSFKIHALARDLGVKVSNDPVQALLRFCEKRARRFLRKYPQCRTLSSFLDLTAAELDTRFEEIHSDDELRDVRNRYLDMGERGFIDLHTELSEDVFGITFRRVARKAWERRFVSVIDCREEKQQRSYFTKWHELAHLLVLTDQMRLSFRRTHCRLAEKDPEEAMMDQIAGTVGFLPELVQPLAYGEVSFKRIDQIRNKLCPEASWQASLQGFVRAWPNPSLLLKAELALKRGERSLLEQHSLEFHHAPQPVLRAVRVSPNDTARRTALMIFPNMRVPERSVIQRVFSEQIQEAEAIENLSWWESSGGSTLPDLKVLVQAQVASDGVQALIVPQGQA